MAFKEQVGTAQIVDNAVTNAKQGQMAANTVKINNTGGAADPIDGTVTQASTLLINDAGTGVTDIVSASEVDSRISTAMTGGVTFIGDYDAATNSPDLDTSPSGIVKGDLYITSVAGTFFTEPLEVGDNLYSKVDNPTALSDWSIVQKNEDGVVSGPASSVSGNISSFNGTSGKTIQDSGIAVGNIVVKQTIVSKAFGDSPYTASDNELIVYDASGGASTVNLPAGAAGLVVEVKKQADSNTVTVDGNAAETIDGALTYVLNSPYESIKFAWNGSEWSAF